MQSIEITGKSIEEIQKSAAQKLGVPAERVKVTVLEEVKGLFGKNNLRAKAEVDGGGVATAKASKAKAEPVQAITEAFEAPAPEEVAEPKKPAARRGRKEKVVEPEPEVEAAPVAKAVVSSDESSEETPATQEDADEIIELLRHLLEQADLQVEVNFKNITGRYINVELDGKDVAYIVGKHGEVLNALQYLLNIMIGRRLDKGVRATLDGNNFRTRREQVLTAHATRVADEVKKRGEEAVLEALPAFERRIVHKALGEYNGVKTYSEGEEPNRRVVIAPAE